MRRDAAARISTNYGITVDWQSLSLTQILDTEARLSAARRIRDNDGIEFDWQKTALTTLLDTEARLSTVKRIKDNHEVQFDWQRTDLSTLLDAEARMETAKRIAISTGKPVDWKQYPLDRLLRQEAGIAGAGASGGRSETPGRAPAKPNAPQASRASSVYVIAPSVSTSMEARSIIRRRGWTEATLRQADGGLVVVRSMLFNPLNYSYDSVKELQEDAEGQLNICGENFHIYLHSIDDKMAVSQQAHSSYKAED
jgi:hypothetical protein